MLKTSARDKVESRLSRSRCVENQCQGQGRVSVVQESILSRCLKTSAREKVESRLSRSRSLRVQLLKTSAREKVESRLSRSRCVENQCQEQGRVSVVQESILMC